MNLPRIPEGTTYLEKLKNNSREIPRVTSEETSEGVREGIPGRITEEIHEKLQIGTFVVSL